MTTLTRFIFAISLFLGTSLQAMAEDNGDRFVLTLFTNAGQIQGTAMTLARTLAGEGHEVHILLCGPAGELAIADRMPETLEPRTITPRELMEEAMSAGASVSVCPLFLPNTAFGRYSTDDFVDGVTEDSDAQMAERLADPNTKVLGF
ncbi:putative peroxiredoxin [Natronocella acetinitrilica]|uniref:Peroxiredoxin n=1 Tax=Natronocella acetinitrilica TaxID=414046 RepID=A0AAE3KE41_9GAMM|nr:hypothetical protein [Natronocella acetinitrilica]MCP1677028.1 putative peroxiredoxin [Natronocella acetinitrilica]